MGQHQSNQAKQDIPKIIHFIWAGGAKPLPKPNKEIITEWAKLNPGFKLFLWIDKQTTPSDLFLKSGFKTFQQYYENTFLHIPIGDFEIHDIEEFKDNDLYKHIRYEIDKLRPNYGASSDLIRYLVLYKYGGAYFDSDVTPNPSFSLEAANIFRSYDTETIYIDDNSQGTGRIGNDAFICTAKHSFMLAVLEQAKKTYQVDTPENENLDLQVKLTYLANNENFFIENTIRSTGPRLIRDVLVYQNAFDSEQEKLRPPYYNMQFKNDESIILRKRDENNRSWINLNVQPGESDRVQKTLLTIIEFEKTHFGILRLDDHINDFAEASVIDPNEAVEKLLAALAEERFVQVKIAQIESSFPKVTDFYKRLDLVEKTINNLSKHRFSQLRSFIRDESYRGHSTCLVKVISLLEKRKESVSEKNTLSSSNDVPYIPEAQTSSEKNNVTIPRTNAADQSSEPEAPSNNSLSNRM